MQVINAVVIITQNLTYRAKISLIATLGGLTYMSEHELCLGNEGLSRWSVFMLWLH